MPNNKVSGVGPALPGDPNGVENFNKVVDFYTVVWGLSPQDAVKQATEDFNRGSSSKIYANRVQQANDWAARNEDYQQQKALRSTEPQPAPSTAPVTVPPPGPNTPQVAEAYRQAQMGTMQHTPPAPISPGPVNAAAQTPAHLEDANLSSWQSLAGLLGYSPFATKR